MEGGRERKKVTSINVLTGAKMHPNFRRKYTHTHTYMVGEMSSYI